jgi:hypothetical protein
MERSSGLSGLGLQLASGAVLEIKLLAGKNTELRAERQLGHY